MTKALAAALLAALLVTSSAATHGVREGGTFRVAVAAGFVDTIDPALADLPAELQLLEPACGALMAYASKPLPEGSRLQLELAEGYSVSRDGKTYTFTVRKNARFSDGKPVTARAFVRAIERFLDPVMKAVGASDLAAALVGGEDVLAGKATTPSGVSARGRVLTLKLTRRIPEFFPLTAPSLCAVPPTLPADPEGVRAPLPSAGPYYVQEYVPGERVVLARNRFYGGARPHHVDRFVANLGLDPGAIVDEVASGRFHWGSSTPALRARAGELRLRYGINTSQFWVLPDRTFLRMFVLNTSRPLFRNNPKLRQAVNLAVNRSALTRELGLLAGSSTDQYLSPSQPGYAGTRIYPLKGDLQKARVLAEGRTHGGKAILYTSSDPVAVAQTQILRRNLAAIGLELEVVEFPGTLVFEKMADGRNDFDIGRVGFGHSSDPSWFTGLFDGRTIGQPSNQNWSYFNSPKYNRFFDELARLSPGPARDRAYGELDVQLSRDAAPAIPYANPNAVTFVSARVGCIVVNPYLDLTAVCLK